MVESEEVGEVRETECSVWGAGEWNCQAAKADPQAPGPTAAPHFIGLSDRNVCAWSLANQPKSSFGGFL